jgi:hypothetical protein
MHIMSSDRKSWIEVLREGDQDYSSFSISCSVEIGSGRFSGTNVDVHFFNLPEFVQTIDQFIMERSLQPVLEGTYGTYIKLWQPGKRNAVMLNFAIGNVFCGWPTTATFKVEGAFPIDQEILNSLVEGFRALLVDT